MASTTPAFVTHLPLGPFQPALRRLSPSSSRPTTPRRARRAHRPAPSLQQAAPPPAKGPDASSSSSSPTPSAPRPAADKPPLPPASTTALYAAFGLAAAGLALPLALAGGDAARAGDALSAHLGAYASHFRMLAFTLGFGVLHSGLAALRPRAAAAVGERAFRVVFALASLPAAGALLAYFIAHRYDGPPVLGALRGAVPHLHDGVWALTFVSFLFLYPATFNLLEVAAVQRPGFRIYEKGITRITRHPQLWGQVMWCVAHCAWIGSSFAVVASLGLVAHHAFGVWNGDRRLRDRFGDEWVEYAERTSVVPFAAVLSGKQTVRIGEFLKPAYVGVVLATLGFYAGHIGMLRLVAQLPL